VPSGATPQDVVALLLDRGLTIATGESLTAGLVAATLADVPGCSAVLRGGVIAYDAAAKADLLEVTTADLAAGAVSEPVARAMAEGAARALRSDIGVATTGVAGPDSPDAEPVGSVWIAVATPSGTRARHLQLNGGRAEVRRQTVMQCFDLVIDTVSQPRE
jgi:nicotinamide-nucleotide amidase